MLTAPIRPTCLQSRGGLIVGAPTTHMRTDWRSRSRTCAASKDASRETDNPEMAGMPAVVRRNDLTYDPAGGAGSVPVSFVELMAVSCTVSSAHLIAHIA